MLSPPPDPPAEGTVAEADRLIAQLDDRGRPAPSPHPSPSPAPPPPASLDQSPPEADHRNVVAVRVGLAVAGGLAAGAALALLIDRLLHGSRTSRR